MRTWRVLIAGFGTVGRGAAERLVAARSELAARGCDVRLVGVLDPAVGSVVCPQGLAPERLLSMVGQGARLTEYPGAEAVADLSDALDRIDVDVLFEATPTDLTNGGVGLEHVRAALAAGVHVATTNKGPIALRHAELAELARERGVQLRAEGTVMSGTPVLNLAEVGLAGAGVHSFRGVLNGTCNFMLSEMESGRSYAEALAEAQRLGYAETDPAGDVEGHDAAAKVVILANLVLGAELTLEDVRREGITGLDAGRLQDDAALGYRWRLVAEARREGERRHAAVAPVRLPSSDPLAALTGPGNLLVFETEALGSVSIAGPGAGRAATGHALVADLVAIHGGAGR
jgi:homoserine dehydrogenase